MMMMKRLMGLFGLCALLAHCGGGGGDAPAPAVADQVAVPVTIKAAEYFPDEMKGVDTAQLAVSGVVQVADVVKSTLRDVTSPVQASVDSGQWQWSVGTMADGDYTIALTYLVGAVPVASGSFPVHVASGAGTLTLTRDGFTDVGGGDLDGDGVNNLNEILNHTDPTKADSDGDGASDGQDAFPLDPKEWKDSDGDGVGDNADNCKSVSNPTQSDVDHDGSGDTCDAVNNNTLDTDVDGVIDRLDAFPLDPKEWKDTDGDGVGDNADNCLLIVNPDQTNTDKMLASKGVAVVGDSKGDACDDDPDGDGRNVVYADGQNGNDATQGYYTLPVKTLTRAMALANAVGADIWVAAGDYDVSKVVWVKGLHYFGGYTADFNPTNRAVHNNDVTHRTQFVAPGKTAVLNLQNLSTDTHFDGFFVTSDAVAAASSGAVVIDNSIVTLANCDVTGDALSSDDAALRIQNNALVTLSANVLTGVGFSGGVDSAALRASNSAVTMSQDSAIAGKAPHATGMRFDASVVSIDQATITAKTDVATQQRATGIWLMTTTPKITKSTITVSGVLVEGIYFEKDPTLPLSSVIQNNTFNLGVTAGSAPNPLLRDWDGTAYAEIVNGDFRATFADGITTQLFATVVGNAATGGNTVGNGQ